MTTIEQIVGQKTESLIADIDELTTMLKSGEINEGTADVKGGE